METLPSSRRIVTLEKSGDPRISVVFPAWGYSPIEVQTAQALIAPVTTNRGSRQFDKKRQQEDSINKAQIDTVIIVAGNSVWLVAERRHQHLSWVFLFQSTASNCLLRYHLQLWWFHILESGLDDQQMQTSMPQRYQAHSRPNSMGSERYGADARYTHFSDSRTPNTGNMQIG